MFDFFNTLADHLYYGILVPLATLVMGVMNVILVRPFHWLHVPIWLHVLVLAMLTGCFSLFLRRILRVDEKVARFQEVFAEKRRRQQDLQLIEEKYTRAALYEVTDEELNDLYNTYLAQHYARYVMIYLLPVFLVMAWLNRVYMEPVLVTLRGSRYLIDFPSPILGVDGLTVTAVFLFVYVLTLVLGFVIKRRVGLQKSGQEE